MANSRGIWSYGSRIAVVDEQGMDPLGLLEKFAGQAVHVDMPRIGIATGQARDLVTVELKGPARRDD